MLTEELKKIIKGEVLSDVNELAPYSRDASIFEVKPSLVVKPEDTGDIKQVVKFVIQRKSDQPGLSITARAGGTDMTGGPLNDSIILDFTAYLNKMVELGDTWAVVEPGMYYRDFEKLTLAKNLFLPSYPASREICTVGGMVANNAGGEKSLVYGKTENFVEELTIVLADGREYVIKPLTVEQLESKKTLDGWEGRIYREMHDLIEMHYDAIQNARPKVSKNSAGYALWNVWDRRVFDLTKLLIGSQGTLGLITKIKFRLITPKKHSKLLVIFLPSLKILGDLIVEVMKYQPESFESYDDHTLKLALRFLPNFIKIMKGSFWGFLFKFWPEVRILLTGGLQKLVLLAEFTGDNQSVLTEVVNKLQSELSLQFKVKSRIAKDQADIRKYWTMRRERFILFRQYVRGKKTTPFIDDIIVRPEKLADFLPRLENILMPYQNLIYTIAGHAGDGNFHIIPLMKPSDPTRAQTIQELSEKVYNLVVEFDGSITAAHNDGLIRTPFLKKMYGPEINILFQKTKEIFDPQGIFNPRKKVGGTMAYALDHLQ